MQCHFYASANDHLAVFEAVEKSHALQYTAAGVFETEYAVSVASGQSLPTLRDQAPGDSASTSHSYLVTALGTAVISRKVPLHDGTTRYAFDQLRNPDSIALTPSAWRSPQVLLYGRIATSTDSAVSRELYALFERAIGKHFRKINAFWVGPEAESAWRSGARLTIGASSPREYDLREVVSNAV